MIRNKLAALLKMRSLISLSTTAVFCTLALQGRISESEFMLVFGMIIAFFFSKKSDDTKSDKEL